jgi:hypothetical protein
MTRKPDTDATGEHPGFTSRRSARIAVSDAGANLKRHDLYHVEIRVQNVSAAGFMAECSSPVRIGSNVSLEIPGIGSVQAQVRWQIGFRMGGRFLDPISLGRCEWTAERTEADQAA